MTFGWFGIVETDVDEEADDGFDESDELAEWVLVDDLELKDRYKLG